MKNSGRHSWKNIILLTIGVCVGALAMWGMIFLTGSPDREQRVDLKNADKRTEQPETELIELQEVDYPFVYSTEGWRLVLCAETSADGNPGYLLRMYDQDGELLQEFACDVDAEELLFRFDDLYSYYWWWYKDLEVFPADAEETGASGLLFPWDRDAGRFREEPIEISWYEEIVSLNAYLVKSTEENRETISFYRINEETGVPVELRRWVLTGSDADSEETTGYLCIWDCLENVALYDGEVEWNDIGCLENEKYYQDLLRWNLKTFGSYTEDTGIPTAKMTLDEEGKESLETMTYESREELLAEHGLLDTEPFYRYYDSYQNLELELYFDKEEERGCGFVYSHRFNYNLEEIVRCSGFIFEGVSVEEWAPEDTFSTLSYDGRYAGDEDVLGYREIYEYTDDGKLSSFEARGVVYWYGGDKEESSLLSVDYVYRNDGTLYRKEYHHHPALFSTTLQDQYNDYDEFGRLIRKICYITHGYLDYYYIYEDEGEKPDYCIWFDDGLGYVLPTMIVYR